MTASTGSDRPARRFQVALSFPGAKRFFVRRVAEILGAELGREQVFYDSWFKAELARPDLDILLGKLYHQEADLVVVFFCEGYAQRQWCGLEWRQMRALLFTGEGERLMPFRFDGAEIAGVLSIDGYIAISNDSPENRANPDCTVTPDQVAALIMERLGEGRRAAPKRTKPPPLPPVLEETPLARFEKEMRNCLAATECVRKLHGGGNSNRTGPLKEATANVAAILQLIRVEGLPDELIVSFSRMRVAWLRWAELINKMPRNREVLKSWSSVNRHALQVSLTDSQNAESDLRSACLNYQIDFLQGV